MKGISDSSTKVRHRCTTGLRDVTDKSGTSVQVHPIDVTPDVNTLKAIGRAWRVWL